MLAAPALAKEAVDSPIFTENINQSLVSAKPAATAEAPKPEPAAVQVIRFEIKMVHYADLPPIARPVKQYGEHVFTYANFANKPKVLTVDDIIRLSLDTT